MDYNTPLTEEQIRKMVAAGALVTPSQYIAGLESGIAGMVNAGAQLSPSMIGALL